MESESDSEPELIRSLESESEPESEQPHHDSVPCIKCTPPAYGVVHIRDAA